MAALFVHLQQRPVSAVADIYGTTKFPNIRGQLRFEQPTTGGPVIVRGTVLGLTPGLHGIHIHTNGNLTDDCKAAGPHFNPFEVAHFYLRKFNRDTVRVCLIVERSRRPGCRRPSRRRFGKLGSSRRLLSGVGHCRRNLPRRPRHFVVDRGRTRCPLQSRRRPRESRRFRSWQPRGQQENWQFRRPSRVRRHHISPTSILLVVFIIPINRNFNFHRPIRDDGFVISKMIVFFCVHKTKQGFRLPNTRSATGSPCCATCAQGFHVVCYCRGHHDWLSNSGAWSSARYCLAGFLLRVGCVLFSWSSSSSTLAAHCFLSSSTSVQK